MSNVVVVVNPSHSTSLEHRFWGEVAAELHGRGWYLVEIATRLLPHTPPAVSLTLPARLGDLNLCLGRLPLGVDSGDGGATWWDLEDDRVQEDWEHRRWNLDERLPATILGLMRLAAFVERTLAVLQPSLVLTTNKIDHNVAHFRRAARFHGIPAWIVERSPLDGIWLEPEGLFAESRIWDLYPQAGEATRSAAPDPLPNRQLAGLVSNPHGFRAPARAEQGAEAFADLPRPLVLLPMDNVLWTGWEQLHHPMRPIDNPLYPSPFAAMEDLAARVGARGGTLVVKPHPACLAITAETVPAGAHFFTGDLTSALRRADAVACFNTKVAFPALAIGKPVLTLAPNPVAASGATYHCRQQTELDSLLDSALEHRRLDEKLREFAPFVDWCTREYFYATSEEGSGGRGPGRFVGDLLTAAGEASIRLDPGELGRKIAAVTEGTGTRRIAAAAGSPPREAPPAERGRLLRRARQVLSAEGPGELARRILGWTVTRLGGLGRTAALLLERGGIDLREAKARRPHLLPYRLDWRPLGRPAAEVERFILRWMRGLGEAARLAPPGSSPQQAARWAALAGRERGRSLWIFSAAVAGQPPSGLPRGARTMLLDAIGAEPPWRPTYYSTVRWPTVLAGNAHLPQVEKAIFLPQRFRGLFSDRKIYWFGEAAYREGFGADVARGVAFTDHSLEAALQIGCYLGFTEIHAEVESASGLDERLTALSEALAVRGCRLHLSHRPPETPAR